MKQPKGAVRTPGLMYHHAGPGYVFKRCKCGRHDFTKPCDCPSPPEAGVEHVTGAHFAVEFMEGIVADCPCMRGPT